MDLRNLLKTPFAELDFSEGFCTQSANMGFLVLEDVLSLSPSELLEKKDFSYHWLGELVEFLTKRDLLHLLQTPPQ